MQELILVISRCISKRKSPKSNKYFYRFHFKGFYKGEKIKVIHLYAPTEWECADQQLIKGDDYFLWVKRVKVEDEILEVDLIKYKKIH